MKKPEIDALAELAIGTYGGDARHIADAILRLLAPKPPLWRSLPEDLQADLYQMERETVGDSTKEIAHEQMDAYGPRDLAWCVLLSDEDFDDSDSDATAKAIEAKAVELFGQDALDAWPLVEQ